MLRVAINLGERGSATSTHSLSPIRRAQHKKSLKGCSAETWNQLTSAGIVCVATTSGQSVYGLRGKAKGGKEENKKQKKNEGKGKVKEKNEMTAIRHHRLAFEQKRRRS